MRLALRRSALRGLHGRLAVVMAGLVAADAMSMSAVADSAIGTGGVLANQLNPTGLQPGLAVDPQGMSRILQNSRSPTGLLYPKPFVTPVMTRSEEGSPWWHAAWADVGYLTGFGRTGTASFQEYGDWSPGIVASFGFKAENRQNADFVSGTAGSVGRKDQYYELRFGRYGLFNVGLTLDATPHLLATNAKVLWDGAGTAKLSLPDALIPGATSTAAVQSAYAETPLSKLSHTRTKTGLSATYTPFESWDVFFNLSSEWRDGSQAIGSTFSFPARGAAELVQPLEYQTIDMSAGVRFRGEAVQSNLTYVSSFFRNANPSLLWENPNLGAPASQSFLRQGRIALAPDNDYHAVRVDLAWGLTDVRFVANASFSTMLQNDALLPPVINSALAPVNLGNWNSIAALSEKTADAAIDIVDGYAQLSATPSSDLYLTIETRYRGEDNRTAYVAYNPLTNQYGYVGLDGALSRIYEPAVAGSDVPIRNIPFATDRFDVTARADYRLLPRTRLNLSAVHKETDRNYREVSHSNDNVFESQISTVGHSWGTVRVSYALADRSGDSYVPDPYDFARSVSLPGYTPRAGGDTPYALRSLHKYDVADRIEHTARVQSNLILWQRTDLQFSGSYKSTDYDADYGLKDASTYDLNGSIGAQFSGAGYVTALFGYQSHHREVSSINVVRTASSDDSAGGPNYPLSNAWSQTVEDANYLAAVSVRQTLGPVSLDVGYTFFFADGDFAYAYAGPGAISNTLTAAQAGSAFPDQTFERHLVEASIVWPYSERILLRGYYRFEQEALDDFHYDGLKNVVGNHLFLAAVPEAYTAHIVGLFGQYRF